jgi:6-pyruvoyltetrahydropterin/6-carboxytetrahydropterin synthase
MLVTKEFTFDSAHFLPDYKGKCENLHGHTYKMHVTVKAPIKNGMVFDFCKLKEIVQDNVISILDHRHLNDVIPNPTAENIVIFVWDILKDKIPLYEVKIWENQESFVTYGGE